MYRPERGSGLHCDNGRLQAGTCASVKEGDNGRDHHNCSSSIHNTFYSQASLLPGILLGISRTPGKILHYPALRCSLKKGCVQAPSHPDSADIITIQHLLQHESFFSSSFPHKMRLINKSGSINSAAGFKCFM